LRNNGFRLIRHGKGSHEIWQNLLTGKQVTVPRSIKSRHTANEVLKQAGVAKAF
jgi:predicted RNA binding protein YcfA (HicA-like mRNA interferase family)